MTTAGIEVVRIAILYLRCTVRVAMVGRLQSVIGTGLQVVVVY